MTTMKQETLPRLDNFFWAGALIWAGIVFALNNIGFLQANPWSWVFLGSGAWGLVLNFFSQSSSDYARPTTWDWGWVILFLVLGIAGLLTFTVPGWLFLIGFGVLILVSALRTR